MGPLAQFRIHATLPASDLARAKKWYAEKLGLTPTSEDPGGLWFEVAGSEFVVTPSEFAGTAKNTQAEWIVTDIEGVMRALRGRGVVFEEYDTPTFKTTNGLMTFGPYKGCWFKDSEGNLLALSEVARS